MISLRKAKLVIFAGGEFCGTEFVVVASWPDTEKKIWGPGPVRCWSSQAYLVIGSRNSR